MPHSLTQNQVAQLRECFDLVLNPRQQSIATEKFTQLLAQVDSEIARTELIDALWKEILAARRSSTFWQEISDVEKQMSDRLVENHVQLQQNYLRLVQEQ